MSVTVGTRERASFCMVTTFYPPYHFGGDAMHVYRLSNALGRRGHDVTVVHSLDAFRTLGGKASTRPFPNEPNVTVVPIAGTIPHAGALATYLTGRPALRARSLAEILSRPFDVLNFHNVSLVGGPGVLSYGGGVKLYTLHEHWLACPMHVLWKNNRELCVEPTCVRCSLRFRRPPQPWRRGDLLERGLRHVDLFLSPSAFTAEEHARRGLRLSVRVLPYFLTRDEVEAVADSGPRVPQRPYFLYVGRLEKLKGVHMLLEAFSAYDSADLVIAGDGRLARWVRRTAARLPHVRVLGFVHPAELRALYARAVAVVVPSLCYEVFPIVVLEAFAQGAPVVGRNRGGLAEAIAESGGGLAYDTEDELVAALERLRSDEALRAELGARGRETLLERWSEDAHLEAYLDAVSVAAARPAPGREAPVG